VTSYLFFDSFYRQVCLKALQLFYTILFLIHLALFFCDDFTGLRHIWGKAWVNSQHELLLLWGVHDADYPTGGKAVPVHHALNF